MKPRRALALAIAAAATITAHEAAADAPPSLKKGRYSGYEQQSLEAALKSLGAAVDPSPEGKVIEGAEIVTLDVFEPRDFIPKIFLGFVNWFHVTSRRYVIEREVLLPPGARYEQSLVDETARNLRALQQLSLVLVVPIRGSAPGRVKLLLITKDVWSLRLNSDYLIAGGKLLKLTLQPNEENFLGTHQSVLATFRLDPGRFTFGGNYEIPRLAGSRIRTYLDANVYVNRRTGVAEGSYVTFFYGQPLYSTKAPWAWEAKVSSLHEITRRFIGDKLATLDRASDGIPYAYKTDVIAGHYQVTRSLGDVDKFDFTFGVSATRSLYRTFDLSAYTAQDQARFIRTVVPVSDTQIGPYAQLHAYSTRFMTILDFETLGLQEDFRLGHDLYLKVYPVTTALRSSRNFLGVYASGAYTVPLGDGLARAFVESSTEIAGDELPDAFIEIGTRIASPRTPVGRLHFDARMLYRYRNYLNDQNSLGGDTRPRGYPAQAFRGKDLIAATLEFRSRAAQILGCQLAGAAFFDTADAFNGFGDLYLKKSVGAGVRILFPQLDRIVMRADWGFPLTRGPGLPTSSWPGDFVITFRQSFPMPVIPTGD